MIGGLKVKKGYLWFTAWFSTHFPPVQQTPDVVEQLEQQLESRA